MRSCLEVGLLELHWTELQQRASLRSGSRFRQAAGDMSFSFFVSHLMPIFVVLLVGNIFNSVVSIAELILNCLCKDKKNLIRALME